MTTNPQTPSGRAGWTGLPVLLLAMSLTASFAARTPMESRCGQINVPDMAPVAKLVKIDPPSDSADVWVVKKLLRLREPGKVGLDLCRGETVETGPSTKAVIRYGFKDGDSVFVTVHPESDIKLNNVSIYISRGITFIKGLFSGFSVETGSVDVSMQSTEYVVGATPVPGQDQLLGWMGVRDSTVAAGQNSIVVVTEGVVSAKPQPGATIEPDSSYEAGKKVRIQGRDSLRVEDVPPEQIAALRDAALNGFLALNEEGAISNRDSVILAAVTPQDPEPPIDPDPPEDPDPPDEPEPPPPPRTPWQRFADDNARIAAALTAWWELDEQRGRRIAALSRAGPRPALDGTTKPGAVGRAGGPGAVRGRFGGALKFEGNAYIEVQHRSALDVGNSGMTVSAWVRAVSGSYKPIVTKNQRDGNSGYSFSLNEENKLFWKLFWDGGASGRSCGRSLSNTWTHVVWVVTPSSKQVACYVNGRLIDEKSWPEDPIINNQTPLRIGFDRDEGTFFRGALDEIMLFNRALSETEVRALFNRRDAQ